MNSNQVQKVWDKVRKENMAVRNPTKYDILLWRSKMQKMRLKKPKVTIEDPSEQFKEEDRIAELICSNNKPVKIDYKNLP
jgi:hypothetical protein